MDDFVVLGLIALVAFLLGPIAFFLTLGARSRLRTVEAQLAALAARMPPATPSEARVLGDSAAAAPTTPIWPSPPSAAETAPRTRPAPAAVDVQAATPPTPPIAAAASAPPESAPTAAAPFIPKVAARRIGIEERLGAHWAVIVGGVALAFGALLLVKYSIEQGFFGPGLRVAGGLLLGAALAAAGEYMRRKEKPGEESTQAAPIPAVLTGAGTVAAFGALYAAHALYGFIGPGAAFLLMGVVGLAAMFAAALHGPSLAGLGLIGALGAPLLVTSAEPNPWPVVPYVAVVCASA